MHMEGQSRGGTPSKCEVYSFAQTLVLCVDENYPTERKDSCLEYYKSNLNQAEIEHGIEIARCMLQGSNSIHVLGKVALRFTAPPVLEDCPEVLLDAAYDIARQPVTGYDPYDICEDKTGEQVFDDFYLQR